MDGKPPTPADLHSPPKDDNPPAARPPPIPDYELLRRIGSGSYGDVWLARNVLGQFRAVKIIYRHRFADPRPFEREFEGIQRFEPISRSHPSQLHILHVGKNDAEGCFFYVMELADDAGARRIDGLMDRGINGPTPPAQDSVKPAIRHSTDPLIHQSNHPSLPNPASYEPHTLRHDLERHGRLPIPDCVQIGLSLATALAHLHEQGLVHRDIKPSNIIFVKGVAKLGDIGLVTEAGDTQSIVGTEGYLPPEGPGTPQADLFSLGKVLYEAATGLDRRQLSRLPDDLRTWPDAPRVFEFNEIVLRACAKDPAERYRTVEQLRADLALLQEGKSVRRVRGKQRLWSQGKKLALGLVLLALVVAGVARLARQTQHNEADGDGKPSTNDLANMFCEKGLLILRGDNYAQLAEAYTNFHRTIELDPHFARPHVGLWELRTREVVPGLGATSPEELRMITRKLKELAPNLAATHCAESTISYHEWDFPHARESALQAIQTDPKYEAGHFLYGFMLMHWGWPVEGRAELETARKLKPSKVNIYRMLGHTFYAERNYTNAIALYREAIALEPNHAIAYLFIGQAQRAMGDYANAINNLQRAEILFGKDASEAKQRFDEYRRAIIEGGAPL